MLDKYSGVNYGHHKAPLYFVAGGYVNPKEGATYGYRYHGVWGEYWTNTAYDNTDRAYEFEFEEDNVNNTDDQRYMGFSLRCLSTN